MKERLQKLIAQAGVASRRGAEELIKAGEVTVNGEIVTKLGTKADREKDHIKVRGKLINGRLKSKPKTYVLLNKPKGVLSAVSDPSGRSVVTDLVRGHGKLFPVGRLDFNTEGLIVLTNDGDFSNFVSSSKTIPKTYLVKVKGIPPRSAVNKLRRGVRLDDGFVTAPAEIEGLPSTEKNGWFQVILHEGHNQQIRKMFDAVGHSVVKLKRVAIGGVSDSRLAAGKFRKLTGEEVQSLIDPNAARRVKIELARSVPVHRPNKNAKRVKEKHSARAARVSRGRLAK